MIDTNCDPDLIDYPIPGNDDALKSICLIALLITESVLEGRKQYLTSEAPQVQEEAPAAPAEPEILASPIVESLVESLEEIETIEQTTEKEKEERRKLSKIKIKEI